MKNRAMKDGAIEAPAITKSRVWRRIARAMVTGAALILAVTIASMASAAAQADSVAAERGPADVELLETDTFIEVGYVKGVVQGPCSGFLETSFIAQSDLTDFWISDSDETGVQIFTSNVENPTVDDVECLGWQPFESLEAAPVTGFVGALETEPGRRYWLGFFEDDGPFHFALTELPDTGERFLLDTTQIAQPNNIVTLEDQLDDPLEIAPRLGCDGPVRMSFVATEAVTTLTTDDWEHEIGVFTSTAPRPTLSDLREIDCAEAQLVGNVHTTSVDTIPGQRYWVTLDTDDPSDLAFVVVDADDIGSAELDDRMHLMRVDDLRGFTSLGDRGATAGVGQTEACGQIVARFTAATNRTVFWSESGAGAVGIYRAPIDPASPDHGGLEQIRSCDEPWGPPSEIGSVTTTFDTVQGEEYWVARTGPSEIVFANAIVGSSCCNTDRYFATPLLVNNTDWDDLLVRARCADDGLTVHVPFHRLVNHGHDWIRVEFIVDGKVVEILGASPYSSTFPNRSAPSYEVSVPVPTRPAELEVTANGEPLGRWTVSGTCTQTDVTYVPSCADGRARIDVIVPNLSDQDATYVAEFSHEVANGDPVTIRKSNLVRRFGQGRIAVTGRPADVPISVSLFRDGVLEDSTTISATCTLGDLDHVDVTTSCLGGRGLVRYAISNQTVNFGIWFVEFPGLSRRSTSAPAQAIAFGGISGRLDGDYEMRILRDDEVIWTDTVTIACGQANHSG